MQDPGRTRREDGPANDPSNPNGQRIMNTQAERTSPRAATQDGSVVGETSQPTTSQGRLRQRTIWTEEINEFIVRWYYRLTKLETIKTPFSKELHKRVIEKYPYLRNKTVQNIIDQRRSVFTNKRLPPETLQRIKLEVSTELGMDILEEPEPREETQEPIAQSHEQEQFADNHMKYHEMDPLSKPKLPKLIYNQRTNKIIDRINEVILTKLIPDM